MKLDALTGQNANVVVVGSDLIKAKGRPELLAAPDAALIRPERG
jgi:hypothetical protein